MSFIENIVASLGLDVNLCPMPYRIVILGGTAGYFENIKGIKSYSKTEIILYLKKGTITVVGEDLYIKKYCEGDVLIGGNILSYQVSGVEKKGKNETQK